VAPSLRQSCPHNANCKRTWRKDFRSAWRDGHGAHLPCTSARHASGKSALSRTTSIMIENYSVHAYFVRLPLIECSGRCSQVTAFALASPPRATSGSICPAIRSVELLPLVGFGSVVWSLSRVCLGVEQLSDRHWDDLRPRLMQAGAVDRKKPRRGSPPGLSRLGAGQTGWVHIHRWYTYNPPSP
jgi:hypothetical protein